MIAILVASTSLKVEDGRKFSLDHIKHDHLDPALKFRLSVDLDIPDWFDVALPTLATRRATDFTTSDFNVLGPELTVTVIHLRAFIDALRIRQFTRTPPVVVNLTCPMMSSCIQGWNALWRDGTAERFQNNRALDETFVKVDLAELRKGYTQIVCDRCFEKYGSSVKEFGYCSKESRMVREEVLAFANKRGIDLFVAPHER